LLILGAIVLVAGIVIGMLISNHFGQRMKTVYEIPPEMLLLIDQQK